MRLRPAIEGGSEPAAAAAGSELTAVRLNGTDSSAPERLEAAMPGHINGTDSGGVVWMSVSETVVCWAWGCDLCVQRVFVKREGDCV